MASDGTSTNFLEAHTMTITAIPAAADDRSSLAAVILRAALSLPFAALRRPGRPLAIRRSTGQVLIQ